LTLPGRHTFTSGLCFSPDGKFLVTGGGDRFVRVWDIETGHVTLTLPEHNLWIFATVFSPDGKSLATGDLVASPGAKEADLGVVRIWDAKTGHLTSSLYGHSNGVMSLAYSPSGRYLASGSIDDTIILWELASRRPALAFKAHGGEISSVAFSPNGRHMASASWDGTVKLWDLPRLASLEPIPKDNLRALNSQPMSQNQSLLLKGHKKRIPCVCWVSFSPDGKRLASAGNHDDGSGAGSLGEVTIWDALTGAQQLTIDGGGDVRCAAFSSDGRYLAIPHNDNDISIWDTAKLFLKIE
jgi:WD40 repeat protein